MEIRLLFPQQKEFREETEDTNRSIYISAVVSWSSGLQSLSPNTAVSGLCPHFIHLGPLTHIKIIVYDLAQFHFADPFGNTYSSALNSDEVINSPENVYFASLIIN